MARAAPKPKTSTKAAKKAPTKTLTLKKLNTHINEVETRLKQIDAVTLRHVEKLESSIGDIKSRFHEGPAEHYVQLSGRLDSMSRQLKQSLNSTQADVAAGLAKAMRNPTLSGLQLALQQADKRIIQCEENQSTAITKLNRHIADIATAVDAQFGAVNAKFDAVDGQFGVVEAKFDVVETKIDTTQARQAEESRVREEAMDEMKRLHEVSQAQIKSLQESSEAQKSLRETSEAQMKRLQETSQAQMERRLDQVESESARAISSIGNKIIDMGRDMQDKVLSSEKLIKSHVSDAVQSSKTEFDVIKQGLIARIEAIEEANQMLDTQFGRGLTSITSRVEGLEFGLASGAEAAAQDEIVEDIIDVVSPEPTPLPAPLQAVQQAPAPSPSPYGSAQMGIPDPRLSQPSPYGAPAAAAPYGHDPLTLDTMSSGPASYPDIDTLPVDMSALPYSDPAYAEANHTDFNRIGESGLGTNRPASFRKRKKGKTKKTRMKRTKKVKPSRARASKPSKSSSGNGGALKFGALTLGTLALGYVATQTILKSDNGDSSQGVLGAKNSDIQIEPAIGNYSGDQPRYVASNSDAANTIEAAARDGNAIAQLQLGVSWLEARKTKDGIDMIRAAANQNQPAALYRLAKLYENGEGLKADSTTARKLTERAARGGNRIAMHDLGLYYAEGRGGVGVDMKTAAKWFEKAAQRGVVDSQYNLAILSESGQGIPTNTENSLFWYSIAAQQGDQMAEQRAKALREQLGPVVAKAAEARVNGFKPTHIDEAANGIFRNMPWSSPARPAKVAANNDPRVAVRHTQTLLGSLGYQVGTPDGAMGPKTRGAIISFERSNGLPETGEVNSALIERLELAAGV